MHYKLSPKEINYMDFSNIRRFMSMVHKAFPTDNRNLKN